LRTPALWLVFVAFGAIGLGLTGLFQNQVPYLEDAGFPVGTASVALGVVGLGSCVGKFFFGWLCDHIPPRYATAVAVGPMLGSAIVLMNIKPGSPVALMWVFSILMGLAVGGWLPTMSLVTSRTFGVASYGAIWGSVACAHFIGSALSPLLFGAIYDSTGEYDLAFVAALVAFSAAALCVIHVRRPGAREAGPGLDACPRACIPPIDHL
jgi:predicted MFS family arabinose efflux permease